jgi:alpha-L-fucosidase 2
LRQLGQALARAWLAGRATGLRARGRCGVDLHWRDGRLDRAILRPDIGGARTVRLGPKSRSIALKAGTPVTLTAKDFA